MATVLQDLKYGLRMLAKNPGFTAVAVITLALGIGANTAIFQLINTILLRRLPVREPNQLAILSALSRNGTRGSFSLTDYELIRDDNRVFSGVLASCQWRADMVRGAHKVRVQAAIVSGSYFTVLGVQPLLGHSFGSDDDRSGASAVAVISYAFWQRE